MPLMSLQLFTLEAPPGGYDIMSFDLGNAQYSRCAGSTGVKRGHGQLSLEVLDVLLQLLLSSLIRRAA